MKLRLWKSDFLLLFAAAIWGFAFVAQRAGMEHVGPFIFNAIRFALGSMTLVPFLLKRTAASTLVDQRSGALKPGSSKVLVYGLLTGSVLFVGASFQQVGIVYTTAGKAGFITGLYVILVPILGLIIRYKPHAGAWLGAVSAVIGLYLLSVTEQLTISLGDSLVLASAFFWAIHVLIIGWLTKRIDPIRIAFMQFAACSILSFIVSFFTETTTLTALAGAAVPILYTGFLSVGVAYTLQVVAQQEAPPAHAAIILSLETVFAALGGWMILSERIPLRGLIGCTFMLAGFIISQFGRKSERKIFQSSTDQIRT